MKYVFGVILLLILLLLIIKLTEYIADLIGFPKNSNYQRLRTEKKRKSLNSFFGNRS